MDQEADESVFEDEDLVTDPPADESQTVEIKIEAEDDKEESVN